MENIINIKKLLNNQVKKGSFCRYDIILRYIFIERFYQSDKKKNFRYKYYSDLLKARNREYDTEKFIRLIQSFEQFGYKEEFPIVLGYDKIMKNGAHRVACSLWFKIFSIPYRINKGKKGRKVFTEKWMIKHGFDNAMPLLKKTKKILFEKFDL